MPGLRHLSRNSFSRRSFNILFFGQDEFSCSILQRLYLASDLWNEIWVATNPDMRTGRRGKDLAVSPLKVLTHSLGLAAYPVPKKSLGMKFWQVPGPFMATCNDPHNILVTASFGRVIPVHILSMFGRFRRFNVHPSLVPLYRGPAPIQHAIADGQEQTGVSILSLEPASNGMDSGDVWGSRTVEIKPGSTFHSLRATLATIGGDLLVSTLREISEHKAASVPQDAAATTMAPFIRRQFTNIQWEIWDAYRLDRVHRAAHHQHSLAARLPYSPTIQIQQFSIRAPPMELHPRLRLPGDSIYDHPTKSIIVRCAGHTEISATLLQQENKRVLSASDFWNGVRPEGLQDGILRLHSLPL